jgi:hypothetical protein
MTKSPQQWLAGRASPPGVLACGMRRPDGIYVCHSLEETCPADTMERILGQFGSLRAALPSDQLAPRWWTWAFDQGQIRFVPRSDDWLLGLVVRFDSEAMPQLDSLSNEFLSLELEL